MSAFIGTVKAPHHNSPHDGAEVWCSLGGVELSLLNESSLEAGRATRNFDPIAARTLAALLVHASSEVERMRARENRENRNDRPGGEE